MEAEQITQNSDSKEFLGRDPIGGLLIKLAVPTVIAQLINMLYNIVDRIYIGHIPGIGATALTGVGVCMPLILIVSAFAALVGYGGAPRASIFMGKKDNESAERTLGMNTFITAQGFAKTRMLSVLIGAVTNIILDPVFIFGLDMDVQGAALATIISQAVSCVWVVSFLCGKKTVLRIRRKNLFLRLRVILPCVALGASTFTMQASESIISVCFNSSLQAYGGDIAVGAMTILTSVMQFAMLPLQGLGQGAQPIISYNYGAGNAGRVKAAFWLLLKVSICYSVILWAFVMIFPQGFAAMFTTSDELIAFTKTALRMYMAVMFLFGIQIACQMTFNALGKAVESIVVAVMRKFVLLIPFIYIMPAIFSSDKTSAVYLAEPVADTIAVTFTAILFTIQFKKALRKMERDILSIKNN